MNYELLLDEAYQNGLIVKEKPLKYNDGRIKGNRIAIRKSIETSTRRACVLAEELGHHHTTVGNILDQSDIGNRKQERKARAWAYEKMAPLDSIKQAFTAGYYEPWDIAEYLDVDERFLREAMQYYEEVHGDELIRWRQEAELREAFRDAGIKIED